jgi:hypothetical protein
MPNQPSMTREYQRKYRRKWYAAKRRAAGASYHPRTPSDDEPPPEPLTCEVCGRTGVWPQTSISWCPECRAAESAKHISEPPHDKTCACCGLAKNSKLDFYYEGVQHWCKFCTKLAAQSRQAHARGSSYGPCASCGEVRPLYGNKLCSKCLRKAGGVIE